MKCEFDVSAGKCFMVALIVLEFLLTIKSKFDSYLNLAMRFILGCPQNCDVNTYPDSKVRRANMGPTWVLSAPGGPHVGHKKLVIWVTLMRPEDLRSQTYPISPVSRDTGGCNSTLVLRSMLPSFDDHAILEFPGSNHKAILKYYRSILIFTFYLPDLLKGFHQPC